MAFADHFAGLFQLNKYWDFLLAAHWQIESYIAIIFSDRKEMEGNHNSVQFVNEALGDSVSSLSHLGALYESLTQEKERLENEVWYKL